MLLDALHITNFRNIADVRLDAHPRFNILSGQNGQGKTNILEAIYLLGAVKSFRPQVNSDLIRFGQEQASLVARVDRGGSERIVRLEIGARGKKIFLNDSPVRQLSDFFGTVNVVMFGPEDIAILKGSPSERRRFIDRAIFNAQPAYATETQHYEDVLAQRNALLKDARYDASLMSVYDEQLVQYGARIIERRLDFLAHFRPILRRTFQSIFDESFEAEIGYYMKWRDADSHDFRREESRQDAHLPSQPGKRDRRDLEEVLFEGLERTRADEQRRGYTLIGPHRDDLSTRINGRDIKTFASQGQHRAFVLAMKIAEISHLEERYRFAPILLLDDVSSELDRERNRFLFDFLRHRMEGQVFITTTHRDYILLDEDVQTYAVKSGEVTPT
ncbi:DNA replication/repair protein RecF [Bradymonas sediminis]|uniref:DNA replication and repair protein RecF n=1 Tax=Bradymonas sediminis TaxID=1548548 RepID=A0A2Z4FPW7_9DELT|nr:DNA replication/repair protein RecF [Bradymonas sediminis]AWV90942.1 DNA replication/repair protein RecF [Bradymonas sediminis]TDP75321.1 DNA replication and repair protein RecF [Bradymonas sediminis]